MIAQDPRDVAMYNVQQRFRKQSAPGITGIDPATGRMKGAPAYTGTTRFADARNAGAFAGMTQQPTRYENMLGFVPAASPQNASVPPAASGGASNIKLMSSHSQTSATPSAASVVPSSGSSIVPPRASTHIQPGSLYGREFSFENDLPWDRENRSIYGRPLTVPKFLSDLSTDYYPYSG